MARVIDVMQMEHNFYSSAFVDVTGKVIEVLFLVGTWRTLTACLAVIFSSSSALKAAFTLSCVRFPSLSLSLSNFGHFSLRRNEGE